MPYLKGTATSFTDLVSKLCIWVANSSIHGSDIWEVVQNEDSPYGTIFKVPNVNSGDYFYIGLLPFDIITGTTYQEWFAENIYDIIVYNKKYLGLTNKDLDNVSVGASSVTVGNTTYSFTDLELFLNSSKNIFIGAFKQYQEGLKWWEQPGGIDRPVDSTQMNLTINGNNSSWNRPIMPPVGFPAIGMDYDNDSTFTFYAIKTRSTLYIVINNGEQWDCGGSGIFTPYQGSFEYALPAYAFGGTSGQITHGREIYNPYRNEQYGNLYDFSSKNPNLSHGIFTFPSGSKKNGDTAWTSQKSSSQFMIMLPDGQWKPIINYTETKGKISVGSGNYPTWYFVNNKPEQPEGIELYLRPTYSDLSGTQHILDSSQESYQLEELEIVQATDFNKNMLGKMINSWWCSSPIYRYGEITIGSKKYLILPSCYENRKFWIMHGATFLVDENSLTEQDKWLEKISKTMNVVLLLGDA
jgi:hypothetical protein